VLDGDPASPSPKSDGAPFPIFDSLLFWPNGWMHQDATWYRGRPHPRRLCARWGPSPLPKKGADPQFSAHFYCGRTAGCIKMPHGMEVGLSPGDFVLDGDPPPPRKGGGAPQFSAHVYCGQTARWIKMPLGTEVGLGPGDIVLDGDPPQEKRGHRPPIFGPCLLWQNGCMYQDTSWYGGRP